MKKLIILLGVLTVSLTSCLKDKPNVDLSNIPAFAELVHSGDAYFGEASITDADDTISRTLQVNITGQYPPTSDVTVTIAIDNSAIATYNAAHTDVVYQALPAGAFKFAATQTITIKAGTRLADLPVTFYRAFIDPAKSYMLPIKIVSVTGASKPANFYIKYYHFIGNDFAGTYKHQFTRTPAAGNYVYADGRTSKFLPNTPRQFEVAGGYYTGTVRYMVTFQQVGTYPNATYSKFTIVIDPADVSGILTANGIAITTAPSINGYDDSKTYTYAQVLQLFDNGFQYDVLGGSGARNNLDQYKK